MAASNIAELDVLNENTVSESIAGLADWNTTRLIVTEKNCHALADTNKESPVTQKYIFFPEIVTALEGNVVFRWTYHSGSIRSFAAVPIYAYGELIGCVYMSEVDTKQGALILSLQATVFIITLVLEIAVIVYSLFFSGAHTKRLRKIMAMIRNVRNGDYTQKLLLNGHDELTLLSEEFNDLIQRLQVSEKKRNQFVSDASHELKTPLASIKLLSDSILQNDMPAETVREFVSDIGNEAERLNRLSQKLLTLSRIDDHAALSQDIIYAAPTIQRAIRMLQTTAEAKNIHIETELSQDRKIQISQDDLYQIVFNLIENGIKYNKAGGKLTVTLSQKETDAVICIEDNGVGIPEESLDHIFERFYRVDKARARSTGGSGLGLSIVRNMVKRNNGKIRISSQLDVGTTVKLIFPVYTDIAQEEAQP